MHRISLVCLESDIMAVQLILCVETNKSAATDITYIMEALYKYYVIGNDVKLSKVYMNSKSRYKSKDVLKQIKEYTEMYTHGETRVIYCIDTDSYETDQYHSKELTDISNYCKEKGYDLVWFCHDIEEVFIGKKVSDSNKKSEAGKFRKNNMIDGIGEKKLSSDSFKSGTSNMLKVFNIHLNRKTFT